MLAALAAFNGGVWIWIARSARQTPYAETQLLLSGVYVAVCGFRSLFPRVDVERVCLWDTWLSAILLGRTAATVAELCFAVQCALFVHRLSEITGMPLLAAGLRDSRHRRHPKFAWEVWREEVPWMTLYFSIGVWTSLAMVLLERAASRSL